MAMLSFSWFLCLLIVSTTFIPHSADDVRQLVFILGDSTADVGTNNHLPSTATANFPYYGIDFAHSRPTGRFSNGLNSADCLAQLFGLKRSPPPFLYLLTLGAHFQKSLFGGVNFASGGSGLLDETGLNMTVVPLSDQIIQFTSVRDNFTAMIGEPATEAMLCKSLFFISIGSNDILGYFNSTTSMPKDQFIDTLMLAYSQHITTLYGLGARRFGIISVPPVGCCPFLRLVQMELNGVDDCFQQMNDFAQSFHLAIEKLLLDISSELPGMKYSLGNTFNMTLDVIADPAFFQFENVKSACCGNGTFSAEINCNSTTLLCPDREKYLFWDRYHPTQKASFEAAKALYNGPFYVSPITFAQLAQDN